MLLLLLFKAEPTSVRRTEGQDPYRCLINVRSSRETEDVCGACPDFYSSPQRTLSARRAPLCCFIAQQALKNTPTTSRFRPASIPPTPRFIWRESGPLFTCVCVCALRTWVSTARARSDSGWGWREIEAGRREDRGLSAPLPLASISRLCCDWLLLGLKWTSWGK